MIYRLPLEKILKMVDDMMFKAAEYGHKILSYDWELELDEYRRNKSVIFTKSLTAKVTVHCDKHNTTETKTCRNYIRARTGLTCCGNDQKGSKLKGRKFSLESIQRMINSATARWANNIKTVVTRFRNTAEYDTWVDGVRNAAGFECEISGLRSENPRCHHLFSLTAFSTVRSKVTNGILLDSHIHTIFHKIYGYRKGVTIHGFICFLKDLIEDLQFRKEVLSRIQPRKSQNTENWLRVVSQTQISSPAVDTPTVGSETKSSQGAIDGSAYESNPFEDGSLAAYGQVDFVGVEDSDDEESDEFHESMDPQIQGYINALTDPSNQKALTERLVKLHERMVKIQTELYEELSENEQKTADALDHVVDQMDPVTRKTVPSFGPASANGG